MAEEPENLVLTDLREIRAELRDVRTEVRDVRSKQEEQGKILERIVEVSYLGVGIATAASVKLDQMAERLDTFEHRLQAVESRGSG